jgi:hypothetical protein
MIMIWALLALYLFGASGEPGLIASYERLKTYVKDDVKDKARRTELQTIVDAAEQATKDEVKARGSIVKELADVSARHEATTADVQAILERYRAGVSTYQDKIINIRFYLKGKMTRDEWAKVFPAAKPAPAP